MRIGVLGPVHVVHSGGLVTLPPRELDLLAVLACMPNQVFPADCLVDALWPAGPPRTAAKSLQVRVHGLRRALGDAGRVLYQQRGYVLAVGPAELDAMEFEDLSARGHALITNGRTAEGAEVLRRALAQWRAAAFAGHDQFALVRREAARLDEVRCQVMEALAEVELASGRPAAVVADLSCLAVEHPYRERMQALLMLALHRAGRQADAQAVYHRTRGLLVEELGVEPGRQLRDVYQALLTEDSAVESAAVRGLIAAEVPAGTAAFTGRGPEVRRLRERLAAGGTAAISGPGGVGKSTLAVHVARTIAEEFPGGQMYVDLHGGAAGVAPPAPADVLARLLRALGLPEPPADLDEAAARFRSLTTGRRMLVVLDDAVDEAQVRPLLPGAGCATLITSRRVLSALDGVTHVRLGTLTEQEAIDLLGRLVGIERVTGERAAAARIAEFCGYLPLALRISGARLVAHPERTLAGFATRLSDARQRLDVLQHADLAVRASIAASRRDLESRPRGVEAFRMLQTLALLDTPDFADDLAATLAGRETAEAATALDLLTEAQLLQVNGPGRYRLHDLVRLYAREEAMAAIPEQDRLAALRRAFGYYVASGRRGSEVVDAGQSVWMGKADEDCAPASRLDTAARVIRWIDAERANILAVVRQAAELPGDDCTAAVRLAAAVSVLLDMRCYWWEWVTVNEIAIRVAERTQDQAAQARGQMFMGHALGRLGRVAEELAHVQAALAMWREVGGPLGESGALNACGLAQVHQHNYRDAVRSFEQSLRLRRLVGDSRGTAMIADNLGAAYLKLGRLDQAIDCHEQSIAISEATGAHRSMAHSLAHLGNALRLAGRCGEAVPLFERGAALHRQFGDRLHEAAAMWWWGVTLHTLGRPNEAGCRWRTALTILQDTGRLTPAQAADILRSPAPEVPEAIMLLF
jgi:DNA-binding SARP family transcriptional activator